MRLKIVYIKVKDFALSLSKDRSGVTLVESLVSIFLVSVLLVGVLGAFFISRMGTLHAQHRIAAMNILKEYMEQEVMQGYDGGSDGEADYYFRAASANPIPVSIDGLTGSITPDPYPAELLTGYKIIGFVVQWNEDAFGPGAHPACSERALTYIADHG